MTNLDVVVRRASYEGPHELVHTSDGKILFVRRWNASSKPIASVLIFHGITAYSAPYGQMIADELSATGFNVFGMDLRGHGLSDGVRGDYPSKERLVKDLTETVSLVKGKSDKLILLGHSLGALSTIITTKNSPQDVDGLILLSAAKKIKAGAYPRPRASAVLKLLLAVSMLQGTPLIEYRREGMAGLDDPLLNFKYSARFYSVMYGASALAVSRMFRDGLINSPNLKFDKKLKIPVLVGVGENDELFSPEAAKKFCSEIPCDNKEFFVIPGARHAFFPKNCWSPLISWIYKGVQ